MKTYKIKKRIRPYRGKYKIPIRRFTGMVYHFYESERVHTDLTKKPKVITQEEILAHNANSKPYVLKVETNKSIPYWWVLGGKEPIKPHKLGIFENLINKLKRGKNGK